MKVAIVGAGLTGATLARELVESGIEVAVFDKSRGAGGQCSTRRTQDGVFDHGAPYFTVTTKPFLQQVQDWESRGVVMAWEPKTVCSSSLGLVVVKDTRIRYLGIPGMNELCKHQLGALDPNFSCRISKIFYDNDRWHLYTEEGEALGDFDALVLTVPPAQAAQLCRPFPEYADKLCAMRTQSVWAVMLCFQERLAISCDEIIFEKGPVAKAIRDSSKPNRRVGEAWVLHASHDWSADNLNLTKGEAARILWGIFRAALGIEQQRPINLMGHRWLYAQPCVEADYQPLICEKRHLMATGSYTRNGTLEGAWLSAQVAANEIRDWNTAAAP
jgi:renalase